MKNLSCANQYSSWHSRWRISSDRKSQISKYSNLYILNQSKSAIDQEDKNALKAH